MNKYFIIFLLALWRGQQAEKYSVIRRVKLTLDDGNEILRVLPDRFIIPNSKCSAGDVSQQCITKGGKRVGNTGCKCECNGDKSTFGISSDWTCINNTKFHELSGCSQRLNKRDTTYPIITIPREVDSELNYFLPGLQSDHCNVTNASNLACNGNWQIFSSNTVKKFDVYQDPSNRWYLYNDDNLDIIEGQILRLNIGCQNQPPNQYCVIFKVKGKLQCPLPSTSSQPTTTTVSTISSTTQLQSGPPSSSPTTIATVISKTSVPTRTSQPTTWWSSILTQSVSSKPKPTFGHGTTTKTKESKTFTATTKPETTFTHGTTTRTKESKPFTATTSFSADKNLKKSTDKGKSNVGLIAGAVAGVIGLAIIAIGIMVVMRRRKKRKSTKQRTDNAADNAGYGRGVDNSLRFQGQESPDEEEYSYAYNVAPIVNTNKLEDPENHNKTDLEPERSVANLVYGHTEGLNQMASPSYNEAPVYNTLEDAVYAKVDKTKKACPSNSPDAPIYNTLEEPEYAKLNRGQKAKLPVETQDESLYNVLERPSFKVLEGPFPEDAPVYDVLEGPESDEAPVYGALEGQDPHVYGALDKPDNQGPPEENRGYDDMVYDSVGDVINDQGDIYQELNQSGQHDSDVYLALNYPGNTVHLNEIKQAHSNA